MGKLARRKRLVRNSYIIVRTLLLLLLILDVQSDWATLTLNLWLASIEGGPVGEEYAPSGDKKRKRIAW